MSSHPARTNAADATLYPEATEMAGDARINVGQQSRGQFTRHARKQMRDAKNNSAETRTNAALATDSWSVLDDTVYDVYHETSRFVERLRQMGLQHTADFMAEFDFWNTRADYGKAQVGQTVEATNSEGAVTHGRDGTIIPAIHDDFVVRYREGAAEDGIGATEEDFDTAGLEGTTRRVVETIERLFIGDSDLEYAINDGQDMVELHGVTTHPDIGSDTATTDWASDPTVARDDVRSMRSVLKNDNQVRPGNTGYDLYVGTTWYDALDDYEVVGSSDYPTGKTMRDAVADLANINEVIELDFMDPKSAFLMRPTSDVLEVGVANDVQTLQWDGPFSENYKVLASMYPRIKVTKEGQVGIHQLTA